MATKRLTFSTDLAGAVAFAEAAFIAVGTPARRGDGHVDLSYVYDAAREIAAALDGFTVVITKSTVPVGAGDETERLIRRARLDADFAVVSNPEFLREGAAIRDFKLPDRIVIGTEDERARQVMANLYRPLFLNQASFFYTNRRTAELINYAANSFLAAWLIVASLCRRRRPFVRLIHYPRLSYLFATPPLHERAMYPAPKHALSPNTRAYESEPLVKPTGFREYDARWLFEKELNLMGSSRSAWASAR